MSPPPPSSSSSRFVALSVLALVVVGGAGVGAWRLAVARVMPTALTAGSSGSAPSAAPAASLPVATDSASAAPEPSEPSESAAAPPPPPRTDAGGGGAPPLEDDRDEGRQAALDREPATLEEQRRHLVERMRTELVLTDEQVGAVAALMAGSPVLGQGNPAITVHPMKRSECRRIRAEAHLEAAHVEACGAPHMVPVYDPDAGETERDARLCVDQFEFPDIPCEYPVVHVRAREAALLCNAVGKRICDAHEWEGACAGALHRPEVEYRWDLPRLQMRDRHNRKRTIVWAYGPERDLRLCGTGGKRGADCAGGYSRCSSSTYPAGAFPKCVSRFGVYDQHGNAAEHMNLPLRPAELASRGGSGATEMKGSWFVFQMLDAHEDDCRWRAPDWHPSAVLDTNSHSNYHLGFRCCKSVEPPPP